MHKGSSLDVKPSVIVGMWRLLKVKEVVNPYFKKKFENFIKTYSIPPKTLIYSIFKIHSYFLKNLKIPPKTAN